MTNRLNEIAAKFWEKRALEYQKEIEALKKEIQDLKTIIIELGKPTR